MNFGGSRSKIATRRRFGRLWLGQTAVWSSAQPSLMNKCLVTRDHIYCSFKRLLCKRFTNKGKKGPTSTQVRRVRLLRCVSPSDRTSSLTSLQVMRGSYVWGDECLPQRLGSSLCSAETRQTKCHFIAIDYKAILIYLRKA